MATGQYEAFEDACIEYKKDYDRKRNVVERNISA